MSSTQTTTVYIKLKNIVGFLYMPTQPPKAAIIALGGAPSMGDQGEYQPAKPALKAGLCVIRPDYIGSSRSDGKFSFRSAVETIYECYDFFSGTITGTDIIKGRKLPQMRLKNIILSAGSFGGAVAPFVDLYRKTPIQDILLAMPVTDWTTQNPPLYKGNESINEFENIMGVALKNIWRGYSTSQWPKIVRAKLPKYNPIDNTHLLHGKNVYIYHGTKDQSVNWKDSLRYYQRLKAENKVNKVVFEKLANHAHSKAAATQAMAKFIHELKKEGRI